MIKRELYNAQTPLHTAFNFETNNTERALKLLPFFKQINEILGSIETGKQELLAQFAVKEKDGSIKKKTIGGVPKYVLDPAKTTEFEDGFNKILDEEVTIDGYFPVEFAAEMKMSIAELTALEFLFEK